MNESSPLCEQRRITFNDDGAESAVGSTRVTSTTLHLHEPHHRLGIITPDLLPVTIYRSRKDG